MDDHSLLTESEEMYLVTIAKLLEDGASPPVPVSLLAETMNIGVVSANQMVRKLEECELVTYSPYKGVSLTEDGELAALRVLRHRRLWEVFLVENLGFSPAEAERQACRVEHVFPDEAIERLSAYLGHPGASPRGKTIPAPEETQLDDTASLNQLQAGKEGQISQFSASPAARAFLSSQGVVNGARIKVLASTQNGDMLVVVCGEDDPTGITIHLAAEMVSAIKVRPISAGAEPTEFLHLSETHEPVPNNS